MPAEFFIDAQHGMVFSKATGVLALADAVDHMDRLLNHPAFRPEFRQLFDFRQVSKISLSNQDITYLARRRIFSRHSQRAFVVSDELAFGMGRMFEAYREIDGESGIVIFREMTGALAWLALSAEPDPGLFANLNPPAKDT